ncbi:phosphomannomutase/phosphoglucomutase [Candidatus Gracilibacteria bacterium CG17_big_fil_post_rev_8_21_14_2_50_48_13]|nr:MAG: phosphomannomutase/phosphoglucomutase [Candidatus Gracilibacteria bacterium CG17_big_fil_post_rev_8_21_14_2_50_48_13]
MIDRAILDSIFKAYDIRGLAETELSEDFGYAFGRCFVQVHGVKTVALGRDMRTSGTWLHDAIVRGLTEAGADVLDLGMVSTDMLYFATGTYDVDAGIMLTASHNPKEYNGIKSCLTDAEPIGMDNGNGTIKERLAEGDLGEKASTPGSVKAKDILDDWVSYLLKYVDTSLLRPMKVVVDAGNGMAGPVVEALFARLPQMTLIPMYFDPDGNFPNHPANPLDELNLVDLKGRMEQEGADIGLAFDGDADRCILVNDQFETVSGTLTTCMIATMFLTKDPHQTILYNAVMGKAAKETIESLGGTARMIRSGHTFIKKAMKEYGAVFAGEHSAHYYFRDFWNADSGIIAALMVMSYLSMEGKTLSEATKAFDRTVQSGEINFRLSDVAAKAKFLQEHYADHPQETIDGVNIQGDGYWFSIRVSNTEPLLRLNMEADSKEILSQRLAEVRALIEA